MPDQLFTVKKVFDEDPGASLHHVFTLPEEMRNAPYHQFFVTAFDITGGTFSIRGAAHMDIKPCILLLDITAPQLTPGYEMITLERIALPAAIGKPKVFSYSGYLAYIELKQQTNIQTGGGGSELLTVWMASGKAFGFTTSLLM